MRLAGRRFIDASIAEPLPYRTALAQGATHVLLLRTRPHTAVPMPAPLAERLIIPWFLRAQAGGALDAWRGYYHRWVRDDEALADHPTVLSMRPPAGEGEIGLVETDVDLLRNAIGTGRRAAHTTFGFLARDNACA